MNVVMVRGAIPCDVMFVGEAPGDMEDAHGLPFVGPAGVKLDDIVKAAVPIDLLVGFANVVGCIPRDKNGVKIGEPDDEAIDACKGRIEAIIKIAKPGLLVCVGRIATDYLEQGYKHSIPVNRNCRVIDILHPAFILRQPYIQQELMERRAVSVIADAIEGVFNKRE